jgi:hypothetical protein
MAFDRLEKSNNRNAQQEAVYQELLENGYGDPNHGKISYGKIVSDFNTRNELEIARATQTQNQIEATNKVAAGVGETNTNITDNTKQMTQQSANTSVQENKGNQTEVPDDIESMAILFNNKSWGMG